MSETFQKKEKVFWELYRNIYFEQFINPVNLSQEKEYFFEYRQQGLSYNPLFSYKSIKNISEYLKKLNFLYEQFIKESHPLQIFYLTLIKRAQDMLKQIDNRRGEDFASWLTSLHGRPSEVLLQQAYQVLHSLKSTIKKEEQTIVAADVAKIFKQELLKRGFEGWHVLVEEMPARMSINQMQGIVKIKKSAIFSESEVVRLKVHEIDTHILRSENAKKQPYLLFRYGFPNYLKTEEGLAIFSEEQHGLLTVYDRQKYALRVLAADYACNHSFYDVFVFLTQWLDEEDAFAMTARVKRGLINTEDQGAYTKDQVYLDGYMMLKEQPLATIARLYYGKIGIEDIDCIDKIDISEDDITYPNWIQ